MFLSFIKQKSGDHLRLISTINYSSEHSFEFVLFFLVFLQSFHLQNQIKMSAVDPRQSAQAQGEQGVPAAPMKHLKEAEYNPAMSTTSKDAMNHWLQAPVGYILLFSIFDVFFKEYFVVDLFFFSIQVSGKLDEVPGIAAGNAAHFLMVDGQPGRNDSDVILNTYVSTYPSFLGHSSHLFPSIIADINCLASF